MGFRLTPHERGFDPLSAAGGAEAPSAADDLAKPAAAEPAGRAELARLVEEAENAGDAVTHEIMAALSAAVACWAIVPLTS